MPFLPLTKKEMLDFGWEQPDFVLITGDAYIDHPSFGVAIISRVLENFGYKICIIAQPDITKDEHFQTFGAPRLGFLISSGNIDSMVNHYSVAKRRRSKDFYTPNGEMGKRPDRAVIVYSHIVRRLYPDLPIILGGIEASLRRLAHFDYWDDVVRPSILQDAKADMVLYGMSEKGIVEVADALDSGLAISDITYIRNAIWRTQQLDYLPFAYEVLPSYREVKTNRYAYVDSFKLQYKYTNAFLSKSLVEKYDDCYVVQNPPEFPLSQEEMDATYDLPYMRKVHPYFESLGHVPALDEVKFSIIANRGCYGGCRFCALTFHQGKIMQTRSKQSILEEAKIIIDMDDFKGYIHDIGGPTANFFTPSCQKQLEHGVCTHKDCIGFTPCNRLEVSHEAYLDVLRSVRALPKVKKVFVRSGLRYDYIMYDKNPTFFKELVEHHISGQLKVAPEHIDDRVLKRMGKPSRELYDTFVETYLALNKQLHKDQFLVPYLMSSHPGSTLDTAIALALYLKQSGYRPEQVQDFYPTPGTASTCMYHTGIDPFIDDEVYIPKRRDEKAMQRALLQFYLPQNYQLVKLALTKANRLDLIGDGPQCLIRRSQFVKYNKSFERRK